jgi:hypothetical protein
MDDIARPRNRFKRALNALAALNSNALRALAKHLEGTTLLCLRVDTPALYDKLQKMAASGRVIPS